MIICKQYGHLSMLDDSQTSWEKYMRLLYKRFEGTRQLADKMNK